MANSFSWVAFYKECADRLAEWESRQGELITFLEGLRAKGLKVTPLTDQDAEGAHFLIKELDPFTFFGTFNRGIRTEQPVGILAELPERMTRSLCRVALSMKAG